jgi:hypothetical protein
MGSLCVEGRGLYSFKPTVARSSLSPPARSSPVCHPSPVPRHPCHQVASTSADLQPDEKDPEVELVLTESDYTMKMFPYKFKAVRFLYWR